MPHNLPVPALGAVQALKSLTQKHLPAGASIILNMIIATRLMMCLPHLCADLRDAWQSNNKDLTGIMEVFDQQEKLAPYAALVAGMTQVC
jgi:hypothetical protein